MKRKKNRAKVLIFNHRRQRQLKKREGERTNRNLEGRSREVKGNGVGILAVCLPSDPLRVYPCLPSPTTVPPTKLYYMYGQ